MIYEGEKGGVYNMTDMKPIHIDTKLVEKQTVLFPAL